MCTAACMERGRPAVCEDVTLQGFDPGGEYKYLGVEQLFEPVAKRAKERAKRRRNPTSVLSTKPAPQTPVRSRY